MTIKYFICSEIYHLFLIDFWLLCSIEGPDRSRNLAAIDGSSHPRAPSPGPESTTPKHGQECCVGLIAKRSPMLLPRTRGPIRTKKRRPFGRLCN